MRKFFIARSDMILISFRFYSLYAFINILLNFVYNIVLFYVFGILLQKIDEAEEEIRELQQTCRTIMKTGYLEKEDQILLQLNKSSKDNFQAWVSLV